MDSIKNIIVGGVITLFIGGTAYTFSQQDVVDNLANDTELTQEQAEQYINDIPEDELAFWDEIGVEFVTSGEEFLAIASDTDCINYEYEWESSSLTCYSGKSQMQKIGNAQTLLGRSYIKLSSENASENDIHNTIKYIDQLNSYYELEIATFVYENSGVDELKMTNSYNKSLLRAALESI